MSVLLLQPLGLFALAALVVPIALHLARRSEHGVIDFAALRWLTARARPRRRVRIVERGLLALRLLLVAALALLLAEPVLVSSERSRAWTVIAPGVDPASIPGRRVEDGSTWRWLAPEFPTLDLPRPGAGVPVASLLRELDGRLPRTTALTIWVPREMAGLDGARMQLQREVAWRIAPGHGPLPAARKAEPVAFAVRAGADRNEALRYLRAASQAWLIESGDPQPRSTRAPDAASSALPDVADSDALPRSNGALVWLRPGALPATVRAWLVAGGTLLIEPRTPWSMRPETSAIVWRDETGAPLARAMRVGRGRLVRLELSLAAAELPALLDGSFAQVLRELLYPRDILPDRAWARDVAPDAGLSRGAHPRIAAGSGRTVSSWLALLIGALFVLERVLATSAHRWRSA